MYSSMCWCVCVCWICRTRVTEQILSLRCLCDTLLPLFQLSGCLPKSHPPAPLPPAWLTFQSLLDIFLCAAPRNRPIPTLSECSLTSRSCLDLPPGTCRLGLRETAGGGSRSHADSVLDRFRVLGRCFSAPRSCFHGALQHDSLNDCYSAHLAASLSVRPDALSHPVPAVHLWIYSILTHRPV